MANLPVATTDEEGRFVLGPLPDGYGNLHCDVPEMHQKTSINELYRFASREYEQRDDVEIVMVGTGIVRVKVVDGKGKPPSRPFNVAIEPEGGEKPGSWGGSANVKEDGTFEFMGVPPGRYTLTARPNPGSDREATRRNIRVEVGKPVEIEIPTDHAHGR